MKVSSKVFLCIKFYCYSLIIKFGKLSQIHLLCQLHFYHNNYNAFKPILESCGNDNVSVISSFGPYVSPSMIYLCCVSYKAPTV